MKKKLLSLIVLAMSISAFAQDPMWIDFEHDPWNNLDIINYWNDMDWIDNQTPYWDTAQIEGSTVFYAGLPGDVADTHYFGMGNPYTVSSAANCTVSFWIRTYNIDQEATSVSLKYALMYSLNGGQWTPWGGGYYNLSSDDGWANPMVEVPAGSTIQFEFLVFDAEGGDAAFAIDDIAFRYGNTYFATFEADDEYESWTYDAFAAGNSPLPDNPFEREGYTFLYWYTWDVASQGLMGYNPGDMYNFAGDYNYFYAAWGKNIIVRYDANGGQGVMVPDTSCEFAGVVVGNCAFTRANYEFIGWNTMANGTGMSFNVGDTIWFEEGDVDITLHAQWRSTGGGQQQCSDAYRTLTPVTAQGRYIWYGQTYTSSGTFQHRVLGAVEGGCDSIYTLQLTIIPQGTQGIDGVTLNEVSVYPNPTMGNVEITGTTVNRVEVMDLAGRVANVVNGSNTVDMSNLSKGVYMFHIITPDGVAVRKVIKK